ncbi:MAG: hypothetical protein IPQ10_07190 [Saprospiraceae bacterium]|nr:hypothetical protein [Saprospiraceae bacterium]MBL0260838.1 hypothetical protein [Saprospiraceae bacterium]
MKRTNFTMSALVVKLGMLFLPVMFFLLVGLESKAQSINIPQLKPVALAIDALRTKMHEKEQIWKSGGANDPQQKLVIDLYMQMIDALETSRSKHGHESCIVEQFEFADKQCVCSDEERQRDRYGCDNHECIGEV